MWGRGAYTAALLVGAASLPLSMTWAAPPAGAATRASGVSHPQLLLDGQSEWVTPPGTGGPGIFALSLSAARAPAGASVDALLYPRLETRYAFEQVVRSGPGGPAVSSTSPVTLASLPPDPHVTGGVDLSLSVTTGSAGGGDQLGLDCAPPTGTGLCTGVYPVAVGLLNGSGRPVSHFTTFLTFVAAKSVHPLEFAWVVPVAGKVSFRSHPRGAARALSPLGRGESSALAALVAELRAAPSVPVTIDASPETLQALEGSGAIGASAVADLASMSADQSTDEVPAAPYVPIDAGALVAAGQGTEVRDQMAQGATVLIGLHVQTTSSPLVWVTGGSVGDDLADGLAATGASQVVVPDVDLARTTNPNAGTWASTFSLQVGRSTTATVEAAASDTWLAGQYTSHAQDPALGATQLLADLAMVHFERPNTDAVRGLVGVPPPGWLPNPTFVRVLLEGLQGNPDVVPVTLSKYFATVTPDGARRLAASGPGPSLSSSFVRGLSAARARLAALDSSILGKPPVASELDRLLLSTEDADLGARACAAALTAFGTVLTKQIHLVSFSNEHTFTLTARTGWIPITVVSQAPYTVIGTLSVSGDKFVFPDRSSFPMTLDHATNPTRIDVEARSSGDLPLHVTFTSRQGGLVIAQGEVTVQSTATSVVGVVLTAVALAVLLGWWARTWRAGRRRRRSRPADTGLS